MKIPLVVASSNKPLEVDETAVKVQWNERGESQHLKMLTGDRRITNIVKIQM